jgi:hypothetical protein
VPQGYGLIGRPWHAQPRRLKPLFSPGLASRQERWAVVPATTAGWYESYPAGQKSTQVSVMSIVTEHTKLRSTGAWLLRRVLVYGCRLRLPGNQAIPRLET